MSRTESSVAAGPFLKWAGGKGRLLPLLETVFPEKFGTYYEPFLGAGAVFFRLAATGRITSAELSDVNDDLIATFCAVRDKTTALIKELRLLKKAHSKEAYYEARQRFNTPKLKGVKRAAHLIYLNKTGYNGLYRVNSSGGFNVPFGRYKDPTIFDEEALRAVARALAPATIESRDYAAVLERAGRGDLVYFDPPYDPLSPTSSFTSYAKSGFGRREQTLLAETFRELDAGGVHVILSNHDTPLVRKLYKGFRIEVKEIRRAINSNAKGRATKVKEVVVVGQTLAKSLAT